MCNLKVISYICLLAIIIVAFTACESKPKICTKPEVCKKYLDRSLKDRDIEKAFFHYNRYAELTDKESMALLNEIALQDLKNIYEGHIFRDKKVMAILLVNKLYEKTGTPFLGEKIGTKEVANTVEVKANIAKAISASVLQEDDNDTYIDGVLDLLHNSTPIVRGITATCISNYISDKYLPQLEEVYKYDSQPFVRSYAIKGLGINDFKTYKEDVIKTFETDDLLGQTIAAGVLLYHDDDRGLDLLKESLHSDSEILSLRALEALIMKNKIIEEDTIIKFLHSDSLLKCLYASELLGNSGKAKYKVALKEALKDRKTKYKYAIAGGLINFDDYSGLDYLKEALKADDYSTRMFAAKSIVKYCRKSDKCEE